VNPAVGTEIVAECSGISILVCKREALRARKLDEEAWAVTGCYVLLGEPSTRSVPGGARGQYGIRARPGMSKGDILHRLDRHLDEIEWFDRAILIREDRGMNSATAGYLEGRLHELCQAATFVEHTFRKDYDDSKQPTDKAMLESTVIPILRGVLELVGVPLETAVEALDLRSELPQRPDSSQRPVT
jgi:hypothetical protein